MLCVYRLKPFIWNIEKTSVRSSYTNIGVVGVVDVIKIHNKNGTSFQLSKSCYKVTLIHRLMKN